MSYQAVYSEDRSILLIDQKELIGLQPEEFNNLVQESS